MPGNRRILLAWELGGGLGHVSKLMLLAERLLAAGYEVWAACQNLTSAEATLGRLGVRIVQSPIWTSGYGNVPEPVNYAGILARKGWLSHEGLVGMARGWSNLVDAIMPCLIVANHAPTLLLGIRERNIPIVYADSPFGIPPRTAPFPNMRYWQGPELVPIMEAVETRVLDTANLALATLGQAPLPRLCDLFQGVDACLLGFPELDHYPERTGVANYLGPLHAETWGESPDWPDGEGKRVFVYLDPGHALFEPLLNQLARLPCRALVFAPKLPDALVIELSKPNIAVRNRPQRMSEVLQQAALVIHHAGNGVASHALKAGVPLLMLPNHLEQTLFALRVGELGAGSVLPNDLRLLAVSVRQALEDDNRAQHARRFAALHAGHTNSTTLDALTERCLDKAHNGRD